jgi:hypothetical protein
MLQSIIGRLLSWPIIQSFIRHSLTSGGAFLFAHGLANQGDINSAIGAAMALIGFAWSVIQKWESTKPASSPGNGAVVLLALLGGTVLLNGCQTPQQASYQAAGTTVVTVDTAMHLWGTYVSQNHPGTNEEIAVESAYEKYQNSMAIVCDAGEAYSATGGTNGTAIAGLDQAVVNASQELTDLENLIVSFGVNLSTNTP